MKKTKLKNILKYALLSSLVFFLWLENTQAQRNRPNSYSYKSYQGEWRIGANLGIMNYFGDLNPLSQYVSTELSATKFAYGAFIYYRPYDHFGFKLNYNMGRIQGDDFTAADPYDERHRFRYMRNAHFRSDIRELSLTMQFYIPEIFAGVSTPIDPYIFVGITYFYYNPKARTPDSLGREWVDLQPLQTEGVEYSNYAFAIPFGIGAEIRLTERLSIGAEIGFRYTFTDYLDDVSGDYVDPFSLDSDLARVMSNRTMERIGARTGDSREAERNRLLEEQGSFSYVGPDGRIYTTFAGFGLEGDKRGEPSNPDVYLVTMINVSWVLNPNPKCPVIK